MRPWTKHGLNSLNRKFANPHGYGFSLFSLLFSLLFSRRVVKALRLNKSLSLYRLFSPESNPAPEAQTRTKQPTKQRLNSLKTSIQSRKANAPLILLNRVRFLGGEEG